MKTKEEIEQLAFKSYGDTLLKGSFIHGYTQCQEDMADESIRFADWINKNDYEKIHGDRWCKKFMSYTHSTVELFEIFIQSLNKQD
jgi:hypothetical protein